MGVKADRKLARLARLLCRVCCCPGMVAAAKASVRVGITATGRVGFAASEDILVLGHKCMRFASEAPLARFQTTCGSADVFGYQCQGTGSECPCDSCYDQFLQGMFFKACVATNSHPSQSHCCNNIVTYGKEKGAAAFSFSRPCPAEER